MENYVVPEEEEPLEREEPDEQPEVRPRVMEGNRRQRGRPPGVNRRRRADNDVDDENERKLTFILIYKLIMIKVKKEF